MEQVKPPIAANDLEDVVSAPRFSTYVQACGGNTALAAELYLWNASCSAALFNVIHYAEVALRNGCVAALESSFGPNWHHNRGFYYTLPNPRSNRAYHPAADIAAVAARHRGAGKVVAELKLAFWQHLLIAGQDRRMWLPHFASVFPGYDPTLAIPAARRHLHDDVRDLRGLRNRIAHHEPIFQRTLNDELERALRIVHWRHPKVGAWLRQAEGVSSILSDKPIP